MIAPGAPDPLRPRGGLDRLFDREKFRRRTLAFYRFAGPAVLLVYAWYGLVALGLVTEPLEGNVPGWLYTLYVLVTIGAAVAAPVLFVIATIGGLATSSDWRFAAPLWLFSVAAGLFLATALVLPDLPRGEQAEVWRVASALLLASAASATVVGYRARR
jgi:hypothetical protein